MKKILMKKKSHNFYSIVIASYIIFLFLMGCKDESIKYEINRPVEFTFKVIEPLDSQFVDKLTEIKVYGTCDPYINTEDIYIYPIVKSPNKNYYPYYKFSINKDHSWDTFLYLGNKSDKSGAQFDVYFCAVFKKDTIDFENAHVPGGDSIKHIGPSIPNYCTLLKRVTLFLK